jgi:hypothetical protein
MAEDSSSSYDDEPTRTAKRPREEQQVQTGFLGNPLPNNPLSVYERVKKWQKVWVKVKHFTLLKWVLLPEEQQPDRHIIDPALYNRIRFANKQLRVEASEQIKLGTFDPLKIQERLKEDEESGVTHTEYAHQPRVTFKGTVEEDEEEDKDEEEDDEEDDRNEQIKRLEEEAVKIQKANEEAHQNQESVEDDPDDAQADQEHDESIEFPQVPSFLTDS